MLGANLEIRENKREKGDGFDVVVPDVDGTLVFSHALLVLVAPIRRTCEKHDYLNRSPKNHKTSQTRTHPIVRRSRSPGSSLKQNSPV